MAQLSFTAPEVALLDLLGPQDSILRSIEREIPGIRLQNRGHNFSVEGDEENTELARQVVMQLAELVVAGVVPDSRSVRETVAILSSTSETPAKVLGSGAVVTPTKTVRAKTQGQKRYIEAIDSDDNLWHWPSWDREDLPSGCQSSQRSLCKTGQSNYSHSASGRGRRTIGILAGHA